MLHRRASRFFTSVLSCVLLAGCGESVSVLAGYDSGAGDSGPLEDVADAPDVASPDVITDVSDASDVTPPDVPSDVSDASDVTPTDVASDAGEDVAPDAPSDVAPVDVFDASPMDAPPTDTGPSPDATLPDVPMPDVPMPDVTPTDSGPTVIAGHRARSLVSAGSVMTSRSYRMVSTLGQTTLHPATLQSLNYRLRGGVIGAASGTR